jgi:hypothetical protein
MWDMFSVSTQVLHILLAEQLCLKLGVIKKARQHFYSVTSEHVKCVALVMASKKKTVLLGMCLLLFLVLASAENTVFFGYSGNLFANPPVAIMMVFIHNVLVVSLILLAMTFYVELVLSFFKPRKYEYIVLQHPRVFALVFTFMIILLSIFRASMIVFGTVFISGLATVVLLSLPNGLIEGYGIYLTIQKTLKRTMTMRNLLMIYLLFFIAAAVEVGFIQLLLLISAA